MSRHHPPCGNLNHHGHDRPAPVSTEGEQPPADVGDIGEGPLFQGMRYDPAQASLFHPPRAFNSTIRPWANHEPLAYVDGMNWYTVEAANPINAVNPLGDSLPG